MEPPEPRLGRRRRPPPQQNPSLSLAARAGRPTEDEQLLVRPDGPAAAFTHTDPWRVLRIMGDLPQGRFSNRKARRLLGWAPRDSLRHLWQTRDA